MNPLSMLVLLLSQQPALIQPPSDPPPAVERRSPVVNCDEAAVGRFVIVQMQHQVVSVAGQISGSQLKTVMVRLDTATGKTWRYIEVVGADGKVTAGWVANRELD